jgi:hypothetical protein
VDQFQGTRSPNSQSILVGGGHFIDPGEPDVLKFVREVLGR